MNHNQLFANSPQAFSNAFAFFGAWVDETMGFAPLFVSFGWVCLHLQQSISVQTGADPFRDSVRPYTYIPSF